MQRVKVIHCLMSHVRDSERKVKDKVSETLANLSGLSLQECCSNIKMVANGIFRRKWKQLDENNDTFDKDTLPVKINI